MNESEYNELKKLRAENARLRALLTKHGIVVEEPTSSVASTLSLEEKVALFRGLFQGREDVFARRWFSPTTGKSGYQPVCAREWDREYCDKKKYKCAECPNREFQPLSYNDIYRHLEGKDPNGRDVVGVYAIFPDNSCRFLCCDFDVRPPGREKGPGREVSRARKARAGRAERGLKRHGWKRNGNKD